MINKIVAAFLAVIMFFAFWSYDVKPFDELANVIINPYAESIKEQDGQSRGLLDEAQKQLYDILKTALMDLEDEVIVRRVGYTESDFRKVIWCIMQDNPDLFWVDWPAMTATVVGGVLMISSKYIFESSELALKKQLLDARCLEIVNLANQSVLDDFSKALFVHDYLIKNVKYNENGPPEMHSAYGAIVSGEAVCDGFAHAFQYIIQKLGVECLYVEGRISGGAPDIGHAWNIVKIDDIYCHVDTTWNKINYNFGDDWQHKMPQSYSYFLISDSEIFIDHISENPFDLPECEGYGYFAKLGLQASNDFKKISDNVAKQLYENIKNDKYYIEFRITDEKEFQRVINRENFGKIMDEEVFESVDAMLKDDGLKMPALRKYKWSPSLTPFGCILLYVTEEP